MTRLELIGTVEVHRCPEGWGYLARVPVVEGQGAVAWGATDTEAREQLALRLAALVRDAEAERDRLRKRVVALESDNVRLEDQRVRQANANGRTASLERERSLFRNGEEWSDG